MNNKMLAGTKPKVIIVDDDDTTRMMAMGFLSQAGFTVAEANEGSSALRMVLADPPDLIILDVEMPGMDGFEVCTALRDYPKFAHIPILMLTGLENDEYIEKAFVAGATDFASKPINWSLLCHRLRYMHRTSLAAEQLVKEQTKLAVAQRIAQMGSWSINIGTSKGEWSNQLYRILGFKPAETDSTIENFLQLVHHHDRDRVENWLLNVDKLVEVSSIEHRIILNDGKVKTVRQQAEPELDSVGRTISINGIVQDVTDQRLVEKKVHQLAYFDTLTRLPNRVLFHDQLTLVMEHARKNNTRLALLYFDLDDFKRVNDSFGHAVGDKLLCEVGNRLVDTLNASDSVHEHRVTNDIIARMGGDEFIIVLNSIQSCSDIERIAERIIEVVSAPYEVDGFELFSSPSIGIACFPKDGEEIETLLKNADLAMYEAKRTGKSMYMLHTDAMAEKALRRSNIDIQMRSALDNDEFSVNYQVQVDLENKQIFSAEALVRWKNDKLGFVSPAEFISVAEDNGLIIAIGEWVLRKSCHQAKAWQDADFPVPQIAVNISVHQFMRSDFIDTVRRALCDSQLPADRLELEITESLLASDTNRAVDTLNELHELGVKLSIDDFGTGYSSLSQLKNFPIDRLKIDQSFIRNITENPHDADITKAIIAMAESMNIHVLAEGVETVDIFQFLRSCGCDEIQGYLISKPVSAIELEQNMPSVQALLEELFLSENSDKLRLAG